MRTYIANLGRENYLWPVCLERSTIATFEDEDLRPFWLAGDREGYVEYCLANKRTAAGIRPTRPVASRWFNLATIVSETENDLWIHREKDELWWTVSLPGPLDVVHEAGHRTSGSDLRVYVLHKPAEPWSNKTKHGARLDWSGLHAKAREFLFTEATLQQLSPDNAKYAAALIAGEALDGWHSRPVWIAKAEKAGHGAAVGLGAKERSACRMAHTAQETARGSGQEATSSGKEKQFRFRSLADMETYLIALIDSQEGLCSLTGLPLQFDGDFDDREMLCSLDRIDSNGHYEAGNLQVVCRFANRWKSDGDDVGFRRLIELLKRTSADP